MATGLPPSDDGDLAGILDLFDEDVYRGEITPTATTSAPRARCRGCERVHRRRAAGRSASTARSGSRASTADDWADYERFNRQLSSGRRRRGDLPLPRPRRRHARPVGPRAAARRAGRPRVHHRHHLRRHVAPRGVGVAGRGQRPLHAAARRRRRARLPGGRTSRRPAGGAVPGSGRGPAARRRRAGQRDGELGRGDPPGRPARLRRVHRDPVGGRERRRRVPPARRRRHHPLGARSRGRPQEARRIGRDQRHRLRRHRAPAHARRAGRTHASLSQVVEAMDAHLFTLGADGSTATSTGARTARR